MTIKMDGVSIIEANADMDASLAMACLFAVYFLFGIEYPKPVRHTLNYMHHYLFNLNRNERRKMSVPVLKMHNQLTNC